MILSDTVEILYFTFFYLGVIKVTYNYRKLGIASIIHAFTTVGLLFYILNIRIGLSVSNMFSYRMVQDVGDMIVTNTTLNKILYLPGSHSIGYFIADTLYGIYINNYTYILHHILSIIILGSVYFGSPLSVIGLFYAEVGGIVHHLKRFDRTIDNKYVTSLINVLYFYMYGYTRILMILNNINCFIKGTRTVEKIQVVLFTPVVIQNMIWLWRNWKESKIKTSVT